MKKYTIFAAAFAMLAFASCNKEENTITRDANGNYLVTFTSEKGQDKAGFEANFNGQLFDAEEAIIMNGEEVNYVLQTADGDPYRTDAYSYCIQMAIPEASAENPIYFLYPASQFASEQNENGGVDYSVTMPYNPIPAGSMNLADRLQLNEFEENAWYTLDESLVWPMHAYLPDGIAAIVRGGHDANVHFAMKNTTAFFTPNVKYGTDFLSALAGAGLIESGLYRDGGAMPELHIKTIAIGSNNQQLSGAAHIDNLYADNALLVMDAAGNETEHTIYVDVYDEDGFDALYRGYDPYFTTATSVSGRALGTIPVAVGENVDLNLLVTFTLTFTTTDDNQQVSTVVYNGEYRGSATRTLARNTRYMLNVDMYNTGAVTNQKVTLTRAE